MSPMLVAFALIPLGGVVVWVAIRGYARRIRRRWHVPVRYASSERIPAGDGSSIVLLRLAPPKRPVALPPVLLVHGLATSHRNHDLHPEQSIARHLNANGRDVWLVTLRSGAPTRSWAERSRVRYDRIVDHDVNVAIRAVLARTGATQLDYVGYSMGGMVLYGAMSDAATRARIRRVAILGSPTSLRLPPWLRPLARLGALLPRDLVPTIPVRLVAAFVARFAAGMRTPLHGLLVGELGAVREGFLPHAMVIGLEDMAGPLLADFCTWEAKGGRVTYRGAPVLDFLGLATMPVMFIAGSVDPLGRVESLRAAHDAWGSSAEDKRFLVLGRATGASSDYSHVDMVVAAEAPREVFEPLDAFLREGA